jgi:hypothetical protein
MIRVDRNVRVGEKDLETHTESNRILGMSTAQWPQVDRQVLL